MKTIETLESPFKHLVMTIGELPTTFVESMSYYETIAWLVDYIKQNIIPSINNNAEAIKEIQDWIKTLDLQDEVDNKLEEMADSGELTEIIAQYLQLGAVIAFNTLSDMAGSDNLANGSICRILGKTDYKDGDGSYYKIRALINTDVVDGDKIVALTNYPTLVAEKVPHGFIGDLDDLTTDDKDNVVDAINEVNARIYHGLGYAPFNVYVDSTNGDDSNDGLTKEQPKKTINNAIETYGNKGIRPEFRIGLKAGSYDFRAFNMTGLSLHLGGYGGAGAITVNMINPNTDRFDVAFYSCHFAIDGSQNYPFTFNFSNSDGMYFDGCHFSATYSTFNGRVATIGGDSAFINCTIPSIRVARACSSLEKCNIGFIDLVSANVQAWQCSYLTYVSKSDYSTANENSLIHAQNSNIHIFGVSDTRYDGAPSMTNFCDLAGCRVVIGAAINPASGDTLVPFTGAVIINSCVLVSTAARWTAFTQHATTTSVTEDTIKSSVLS